MPTPQEPDYPPGHPARFDFNPDSPEAKEWLRRNSSPLGERDYPVDHPKAVDTPGNTNAVPTLPGVDPDNPHLEAFTGRTPQAAERIRAVNAQLAQTAKESAVRVPTIAPLPNLTGEKPRAVPAYDGSAWAIHCPACHVGHVFDSRWAFNGDTVKPSFNPSMLVNAHDPAQRCHSWVQDGLIRYLSDCGHALKDQTVELPPI